MCFFIFLPNKVPGERSPKPLWGPGRSSLPRGCGPSGPGGDPSACPRLPVHHSPPSSGLWDRGTRRFSVAATPGSGLWSPRGTRSGQGAALARSSPPGRRTRQRDPQPPRTAVHPRLGGGARGRSWAHFPWKGRGRRRAAAMGRSIRPMVCSPRCRPHLTRRRRRRVSLGPGSQPGEGGLRAPCSADGLWEVMGERRPGWG